MHPSCGNCFRRRCRCQDCHFLRSVFMICPPSHSPTTPETLSLLAEALSVIAVDADKKGVRTSPPPPPCPSHPPSPMQTCVSWSTVRPLTRALLAEMCVTMTPWTH